MVAGLEEVTSGTIRIDERDVTPLPPRERDVAMVFQDYGLYPHMTVRENLSLGLRVRKIAPQEIDRRVTWAAGMLGLAPLLDRKPKQLSGGQRQRVAMGRAMVREPKVFLFDEPLSNLDAGLRAQMRIEIGGLQRRLKTTTIYVTHDQVEAMTLGDRIVVLADGRIQQIGRPIDLYRAPVNRFVAGFIGTPPMNFVEGSLREENGQVSLIAEGISIRLPREKIASGKGDGLRDTGDTSGGPSRRFLRSYISGDSTIRRDAYRTRPTGGATRRHQPRSFRRGGRRPHDGVCSERSPPRRRRDDHRSRAARARAPVRRGRKVNLESRPHSRPAAYRGDLVTGILG